jgi:LPXTG-motif cell wall-anchored protein
MFASSTCSGEIPNGDQQATHEHALVTINGNVQVYQNAAMNGGAVYVGGGKLTVNGGIVKQNKATGTPGAGVKTAYNTSDNVGVGGGLYVYDTGALDLQIKTDTTNQTTNLGVYSNEAEFAADDVYCGPKSTSIISLPKATKMNLTDYRNNVIGYVINWFEDYPNGDSEYSKRAQIQTTSDSAMAVAAASVDDDDEASGEQTTTATSPVRYRSASESQKTSFDVTDNGANVNGYLCLTLGYKYTRVNLTIAKELPGADANSEQTFAFEVTIYRPTVTDTTDNSEEANYALAETEELIYTQGSTDASAQEVAYTITSDSKSQNTATVTFNLQAGQSVTLEGIPAYAQVTIEEKSTDAPSGVAAAGSLYIPAYTWDGNGTTGNDTRTLTQDGMACTISSVGNEKYYTVTCTNLASGAQLPQTGGSGTQRYVWCGLALMALAAGGTLGGKRRKRRARKGADAQ